MNEDTDSSAGEVASGSHQELDGQTSYEELVRGLEEVVRALEGGDMPLERSLELFEEGIRLSRLASTRLKSAEQRLEELLANGSTRPIQSAPDTE